MLMFFDMGGGGVHEKITDYVDMGRGLLKLLMFVDMEGGGGLETPQN